MIFTFLFISKHTSFFKFESIKNYRLNYSFGPYSFTLLIQLWAWERCPTLVPSFIPPQQQNAPLAYRYTFLYYFELIINKYAWLMLIIILYNILFCYLIFCEDGWEVNCIT